MKFSTLLTITIFMSGWNQAQEEGLIKKMSVHKL